MIPRRIVLQNFRAIAEADIDLTEVTIAAVTGRNGAGKSSTFTLAPVFALFGDKIKGIGMDDLVRRGAQEMAVAFEFEHNGSVFQVIRTRSVKGNGKSTLELMEWVEDRWMSRSAEKIKDTEKVICELLNLDVETFTASSMILQGKANEFTSQTAGKRKEILQQVLGLSIYDRLQELARKRAAELNLDIEKTKMKLADLTTRLQSKPEKQQALQELETELENVRSAIEIADSELRQQEDMVRDLEAKAVKVRELASQLADLCDETVTLESEKTELIARASRASKILANEAEIIAKTDELQTVKEQIAVLEARVPDQDKLLSELQHVISSKNKLQQEQGTLDHRIRNVQQLLSNRDLIMAKAAEYQTATTELQVQQSLADQWEALEKQIADNRSKQATEQMRIATTESLLGAEIKALEAKTIMLEDSNCIDVERAACRFLADAQDAKRLLGVKRTELAAIDHTELTALQTELSSLIANQTALGFEQAEFRSLKVRVDELRPLAEQAGLLKANEEILRSLQDQNERLNAQIAELIQKQGTIQAALQALEKDLAPLSAYRERADKLHAWAKLKDELAAARETKRNADERIAVIDLDHQKKEARKQELELERSIIALETLKLDEMKLKIPVMRQELKQFRDQENRLSVRIGGLQSEIVALESDEQEHARLSAEMEPKSKEWSRYQTLIRAFGKDGIPALIIENAVPELERIANEILGQMSKGKHYIRFETQKELKSREGVSETLDIIIGDWTSERPYETFSGGEQLRIDYAIRFALAELLSRRAGSRVEWLTIDEGLGSQDAEHRTLVLEAIKSVADRFKKVLVITHIEDAQAVFDQQIVLENSGEKVEVNVA